MTGYMTANTNSQFGGYGSNPNRAPSAYSQPAGPSALQNFAANTPGTSYYGAPTSQYGSTSGGSTGAGGSQGYSLQQLRQGAGQPGSQIQGGGGMAPMSQVFGNAGIGSFPGQQYGGGVNGLMQAQMAQNAQARNDNLQAYQGAQQNLAGVPGRFGGDALYQQARQNAMGMAQNYQLDPQLAINRASNLVNASANSAQRGLQGQMAEYGQSGGSAQQGAMGALERARMAQLAGVGSDIQTQYGQMNWQRGLEANQQASGLAGQLGQFDYNTANSLMSNLPQYLPEDYSGWGSLLGMGQGGGGQSVGSAYGGMQGGMSSGIAGAMGGGFARADGSAGSTYIGSQNPNLGGWGGHGVGGVDASQYAQYAPRPNPLQQVSQDPGAAYTGQGAQAEASPYYQQPALDYSQYNQIGPRPLPQFQTQGQAFGPGIMYGDQHYAPGTYANKAPGIYY